MTTLTLELQPELYDRLREEAAQLGETLEKTAETLLSERLAAAAPAGEKAKAIAALRAAGLLTELDPEEIERSRQVTMTLEEIRAAMDASEGKPLSEVIIEMRGPKV